MGAAAGAALIALQRRQAQQAVQTEDQREAQQYALGPAANFGLDPNDGNFARDTRAFLARSDFEDWKRRFLPVDREVAGAYGNIAQRADLVNQNVGLANASFANAQGQTDRRLASFGTQLTPEQQAASSRNTNLAQGLASVNAVNQTNRALDQRDLSLLSGGIVQKDAVKTARGQT